MLDKKTLVKAKEKLKNYHDIFFDECSKHDIRADGCIGCPLETKNKECLLVKVDETLNLINELLKELPF